jgi:hypothetical protein
MSLNTTVHLETAESFSTLSGPALVFSEIGKEHEPMPATASAPETAAAPSKLRATRWYHFVAYLFGGAFLTNALPHFVQGVSGRPLQSPFASPPGVGLSSAWVNVLWGLLNLVVGYLLVCRVGTFDLRRTSHVVALGLGVLTMGLMLARTFGKFYGGLG